MSRFPGVGDDFGDYHLTGEIGRGGMGVVFAAQQRRLDRTVALKVLAPQFAEHADYRERFVREATVLARLDSPHVISIYDHGQQDGCLYIAMQYIRGGDLGQALRRYGAAPPAQALQIVAQLASALSDAHGAGIVHRDLKPENVLLRDSAGEVHAYLCDFGIAQGDQPGLTVTGGVAGTLGYLAPERCTGQPATASTDLYALGCIAWTALVGSQPYAGTDVEVGIQHLSAPLPQLVEHTPVVAGINHLLRRALAKDPSQRYPTAAAMREDVLALTERLRTEAPGPLTPVARPGPPPAPVASVPSAPPGSFPPGSVPPGSFPPGSGSFPPLPGPAPRRSGRRAALVVVAVVAAVVAIAGGVTAVALTGDDDPETRSASPSDSPSPSETTDPTEPSEPTASPATPTITPTNEPRPTKTPTPTYPDVPAARGIDVSLGAASLRALVGWGRIDPGVLSGGGVGARDYDDYEGYYSSVFIRRSEPAIPLTDLDLLEIVAMADARNVGKSEGLTVDRTEALGRAWLDGEQAFRVRAYYHSSVDDLSFIEESYYAQRGKFLYRVTFQNSKIDTNAERRAQIDPMVVSFRWR
jgi:serine/threonine protein kinase